METKHLKLKINEIEIESAEKKTKRYVPLSKRQDKPDSALWLIKQHPILKDSQITIMSTDKDFLQLANSRIKVWSPTKKKMYDEDAVLNEYGITSHNLIWYRVLDGDKSDNISGVRGLGLKTIQKKLPFLSENRIVQIDEVLDALPESKDVIELNYKLMQLSDVDISASTKTKIIAKVNEPIQRLIKFKFEKMFLEDKLYTALPNVTSWLVNNFNQLNHYAEKSHEGN